MKNALLPLAVGLGLFAALVMTACGDDDESTPPAAPPPPVLSIARVQGVGGPSWRPDDPGCVELGHDADQTVVVTLELANFTLRPPGTCGSARVCGTAVLRVDPSGEAEALRVQAAQSTIEAGLATLGAGQHTFRVELRDRNGEPVLDAETKAPLFSEVALEVKPVGGCGGGTDGGTDGGSDASPDADASSDASPDADAESDASDAADATDAMDADAGD
ncbi:MAG: hypothetical protein HYZ29_12195 [Myxococcales bacterium]|nr:hypothetical protein [Myxococcales bacterium]